jgi:tetratricopeptide (TPR) repeat protein
MIRWWLCAAVLATGCSALAIEIQLPLNLDGLKPLLQAVRKEGIGPVRKSLEQTQQRARNAGDARSEAYAVAGLAGIAEFSNDFQAAETTLRAAVALAITAGDQSLLDHTALWFAQESARAGRRERCLAWAEVAAKGFRAKGDKRNLARALHVAFRFPSSEEQRRELLDQALEAAREGGDTLDIAFIEIDVGEALRQSGHFGTAILILEKASVQLEQLDAWSEAGRALTMLARAYSAHSRHDSALEAIRKAEALLERSGESVDLMVARQEMGSLFAATGDRKRALAIFEQVHKEILASQRTTPSIRLRATVLANGYLGLGEYRKAVELASKVVEAFPDRAPLPAYWILASAYFHLQQYYDAVSVATKGLKRAGAREEVANVSAYRWRALALDRLGRFDEAASDMMEAVRFGNAVRGNLLPDDEGKRAFSDNRQQFVHDAIAVLWRAGRWTEAWHAGEQARARAFLDLMASKSNVLATPATPAQILELVARGGESVISYWVHPEAVYVWIVIPGGKSYSARIPIREKDLRALVERARALSYKPSLDAWRELYRILIQPVAGQLSRTQCRRLALLPHGPLLQLPFGALLSPSGRYLIEDYSVRSAPAASILASRELSRQAGPFVLIGAPHNTSLPALPGAKREVERIAALTPGSHRLLQGALARVDLVRREASKARVLHFATHAVDDEARPFDSFLALSDG